MSPYRAHLFGVRFTLASPVLTMRSHNPSLTRNHQPRPPTRIGQLATHDVLASRPSSNRQYLKYITKPISPATNGIGASFRKLKRRKVVDSAIAAAHQWRAVLTISSAISFLA